MNIPILQVALRNDNDLITARQRTKAIAEKAGLGHQDQTRLITAVSEIARNALMYAGGGTMKLAILNNNNVQFIQVTISDKGPGIKNLDSVLAERYVSKTGLGKGIAGSKRIVDLFEIASTEKGTSVTLGKAVANSVAITPKSVQSWMKSIEMHDVPSPIDELQQQNQQLMQALEELQKLSAEVEEASRQKGQFLANISHEIRTPLNAILGLNKILGRTALDSEQQRIVKLTREAGQTLLALINDVLDLSKIESGKMQIHKVEFDFRALLTTTIGMLTYQADEKGIELSLTVEEKVPPYLVGDDLRVKQILVNLVGNAVKFSDSGTVAVAVTQTTRTTDSCKLRITVHDSGPGISDEQQKLLFQTFSQVDASVTRKHGGTGLGLAICHRLVEMMGGEIGVESALRIGSTFWFEIPFGVAAERREERAQPHEANQKLEDGYKARVVLVAEDHPVNRLVAISELEELGFTVDVAVNGEEACQKAAMKDYGIIFMDCQMPVMDGYSAAREIRNTKNNVPIVAMTANALEGERERCLAAGMDDYISKPFEQADLERVIAKLIKPSVASEPVIDEPALRARFKPANMQRVLAAFVDDLPISVGLIQKAFEQNDLTEVARVAHSFKGACSMIYANSLSALLGEIEDRAKQQNGEGLGIHIAKMQSLAKIYADRCEMLQRRGHAEMNS